MLAPDNVIPYDSIDSGSIRVLKDIRNKSLSSKMSIVTQAQVLKSMLDPKVRYVPSITGMSPELSYFRYAYCQPNFRISGISLVSDEGRESLGPLLNFRKVVEYAVWTMKKIS